MSHEYTNGAAAYSCIRVVFEDGQGPVAGAVHATNVRMEGGIFVNS